MARPLRIEFPGAVYHVTSRGNARSNIFFDDQDRKLFLKTLSSAVETYNWLCHAYCLMDNHYHLLIETPDGNLSQGMRQLNGIYTQAFNRRHQTVGHLFQGRFKAFLIEKESYLLEVVRYIVLNPIRAKMVKHPKVWGWSSYQATAGMKKVPDFLTTDWILGRFYKNRKKAQKSYQGFVMDGIKSESPFKDIQKGVVLGDLEFIDKIKNLIQSPETVKEIPRAERMVGRPDLDELFTAKKIKDIEQRNAIIRTARVKWGYLNKEIADHLKLHYTTISRVVNEKKC